MSSEKLSEQPEAKESPQRAASVETPQKPSDHVAVGQTRILHLSDLHFGRGFDGDRWTDLTTVAEGLKPNLIIVSGDLVNNPFRWMLRRAKARIEALRKKVGCAHEVIYVPGNHDARIIGIVPARRLLQGAVAIFLVAAATWWRGFFPLPAGVIAVAAGLTAIMTVALFGKFEKRFGALAPVTRFDDLGIEIFLYDSASRGAYWAQGFVTSAQFPETRRRAFENARDKPSRLFRIGVVHHHALPIPFEHVSEPMMVLRNAGMFLHEASALEIPLVLHGHRHKFSFGRVTIEANDQPYEIAVLSTGSATAGWEKARLGHNFNLIALNRWRNAEITRYSSPDGRSFQKKPPFLARTIETATRDSFVQSSRASRCRCDSMIVTVEINADGDAHRTILYRGLRAEPETSLEMLPGPIKVDVATGHVERIRLTPLDGPPSFDLTLRDQQRAARAYSANIHFSRPLVAGDDPVDFRWEYDEINSFAMSVQQFGRMYPEQQQGAAREWVRVGLKNRPIAELTIVIKLPAGFEPAGTPQLAVLRPDGTAETELQKEYNGDLVYESKYNIVTTRIAYPPLDLDYKVEWPLRVEPPPTAHVSHSLTGALIDAVRQMLQGDAKKSPLNTVFEAVAEQAVAEFKLDPAEAKQIELNIMAYDESRHRLKIVAANFKPEDPRWDLELGYGDGIAGRCYKLNRPRVFVKQIARTNGTPYYYAPLNDQPVSDDGREVTEEVVVSLPLYHPNERAAIFGVLNLSSLRAGSRLADLQEEDLRNKAHSFIQVVASACLTLLESLP